MPKPGRAARYIRSVTARATKRAGGEEESFAPRRESKSCQRGRVTTPPSGSRQSRTRAGNNRRPASSAAYMLQKRCRARGTVAGEATLRNIASEQASVASRHEPARARLSRRSSEERCCRRGRRRHMNEDSQALQREASHRCQREAAGRSLPSACRTLADGVLRHEPAASRSRSFARSCSERPRCRRSPACLVAQRAASRYTLRGREGGGCQQARLRQPFIPAQKTSFAVSRSMLRQHASASKPQVPASVTARFTSAMRRETAARRA